MRRYRDLFSMRFLLWAGVALSCNLTFAQAKIKIIEKQGAIYLITADDSNSSPQEIWLDKGRYALLSPDSKKIVYYQEDLKKLCLLEIENKKIQSIVLPNLNHLHWSPDSSYLLVASGEGEFPRAVIYNLSLAPVTYEFSLFNYGWFSDRQIVIEREHHFASDDGVSGRAGTSLILLDLTDKNREQTIAEADSFHEFSLKGTVSGVIVFEEFLWQKSSDWPQIKKAKTSLFLWQDGKKNKISQAEAMKILTEKLFFQKK